MAPPRPRGDGDSDGDSATPSRTPGTAGNVRSVNAAQGEVQRYVSQGTTGTPPAQGGPPQAPSGQNGGPTTAPGLPGGPSSPGRPIVDTADPNQTPTPAGTRPGTGDPIDVATGEVVTTQTDLRLDGVLPLVLSRTHVSSYRVGRLFGRSWASTLDQRLEVDRDGVCYASPDGMLLRYPTPVAGAGPVPPVAGPRLELAAAGDGYTVTDPARGHTLHFARPGPGLREWLRLWPLTAVSDRAGNRIELDYGQDEFPTAVRHSGGCHVRVETARGRVTALRMAGTDGGDQMLARYRYDEAGQLAEVVNSSGEPTVFDYDAEGRLLSWQNRIGDWHRFDYDATGRCVRTTGSGRFLERRLAYDPATRTTTVTDSLGHTSSLVCNERGRVVRRTDELGRVTVLEWDRRDQLLSRTDPLGRTVAYRYDDAGNLTTVVRPDGSTVVLTYNELRQPTSVTAPDQTVRRLDYDRQGNLTAATDQVGAVTRYEHREHGHLASVTDPTGVRYRVTTDRAGLPVEVTDPTGAATRYERDASGRPVRITDPTGGVTELGWTAEGRPAWRRLPDGATERWRYDAEGNLVERVDPTGAATRYEIGPFGLVTARTDPDGTRLAFDYDTELRLTAVTNPQGLVWRYAYDPAGQLVSETDFNGHTVGYRHDPAGQLVSRVNGTSQAVHYRHDPLGNLVEQRADDELTTFAYDPAGRVTHARNPDADVTIEYDPAGRVVAETCNGATVSSLYDAAGRRVHRRTPAGVQATWSYDARGLPAALRTAGHALDFTHDPAGRETGRSLDAAVRLAQAWDAGHRLVAQSLTAATPDLPTPDPPRVLARRRWSYRADGRPTGAEDDLTGPRQFDLDPAGRVTAVHGGDWTERYAYDTAGNLTDATWPRSGTDTLDADSQGTREYAGTVITRAGRVRYEYDDCGRITLRQQRRLSGKPRTWRYTWNAEDRLTSVTTPDGARWRYRYDPLGRRIAKQRLDGTGAVAEQVDFRWDGPVLAQQTHRGPAATGQPAHDRITVWEWAPDTVRPLTQSEVTTLRDAPQDVIDRRFYAIVTDLVAAPTELVAPDGEVAWRHQSTLWGSTVTTTGTADCPLRFPGQYHDPETGAYYNFYRYYDPATARYHTPDPLGLAPAPNPHTYVPNPHVQIDPLGLDPGQPRDGGMYGQLQPAGSGNQINHIPAQAATRGKITPYSGPAIRMRTEDHMAVYSTGRSHEAQAWRQWQRDLVESGRIDDAIQMDINDITRRFPGRYEGAIIEMFDSLSGNAQYQALRIVPRMLYFQPALF